MRKPEVHPVIVRIEARKYRALRHQLLDAGVTFNGLVNKLLDEHIEKADRRDLKGAGDER